MKASIQYNVHNPVAIANWFLDKSEAGLTLMQILKLSYIAHGFKLGLGMGPMSEELVEAWKHGPVFPSVYHEFKFEPPGKITALGTEIDKMTPVKSSFNAKEEKVLELVYDIYGEVEGWQLSGLTHKKGTPWHIAYYENGGKYLRGVTIENDVIEEHFKNSIIEKYNIHIA